MTSHTRFAYLLNVLIKGSPSLAHSPPFMVLLKKIEKGFM